MARTTLTRRQAIVWHAPIAISALAALTLAAAACSSTGTVSKDQVQNSIGSKISDKIGHKPDSVSCPDDLKATVGATLDCTVKDGGQSGTANVKVTSVDGSTAHYDINAAAASKDDVASQITTWAAGQLGHQPDSVTCPGGVFGATGLTVTCHVVDAGEDTPVNFKVTGTDGNNVKYEIST